MNGGDGQGLRVLLLEDEALVAMLMEDMLTDLGCVPVGPFAELAEAQAFVRANPQGMDAAIIDINVAGYPSYPLAQMLKETNVPFAFSTGYDVSGIEPEWRQYPWLRKPFMMPDLEQVLATLRSSVPA
ncbi:CheY-like chemotaxis protein [Stella humosa]|uniref:CheY-like chemotaxis protein n=1 Tax=Stella humosa TaxID=94 RepID=A0A3N1KSW6_9PROT|nr:response regulator [Stella humosa]ROP81216.1 CheY-like chemotaxis protein [Stella humosa]BBK32563.1 response regulator [Stella humosa]